MKKSKLYLILGIILIIIILLLFIGVTMKKEATKTNLKECTTIDEVNAILEQLEDGMTYEEVVKIIGEPDKQMMTGLLKYIYVVNDDIEVVLTFPYDSSTIEIYENYKVPGVLLD